MTKHGILLFLITTLSGCSGDEPGRKTDSKDRTPMLIHWADNIIVPAYNNFKTKLDAMVVKGDAFAANPTQTSLIDFRRAWVDAYIEWQKAEMFEIGPAEKYTLRSFFNIYPADVQAIHQNIADPTVNLNLPPAYPTQGFPALDYLINGVGDTDEAIVSFYTTAPEGASRINYLKRLTSRMDDLLTKVVSEWSTYRETFISKTGLDIGSSTGLMVNAYVLYYERYIRSGKFGIPSGAMTTTGGAQYPDKVEAVYKKDISLTLAKTAHQAVIDFFNGKNVIAEGEGLSLKSYLNALGAKDAASGTSLSQIINDQFSAANAKMDLLSENLYEEVQTNNNAMIDVFTEMQKATRMLKVDMTSAMSITITYTDNDGD
jgi:predicted lipoprotein